MRPFRRLLARLAAAVAPALAVAAPAAKADAPLELGLPAPRKVVLANGLRVILMEDRSAPVVAVQVWYHVGSKDEVVGKRGLAHLFEHLMFRGTAKHGPGEFDRRLDEVGGENNAFTSEDVTAYHETLPAEHLPLALALEADRMRGLTLRPEIVDREREVVKEEKRLRLDNDPMGRTFEAFLESAFETHPYRWTPAGTIEDLDTVTTEEAKAFYDRYYRPNNAVLVVVGAFDPDRALETIERAFGPIPPGPKVERKIAPEPAQRGLREKTVRLATQLPVMIGGYKIPAISHPDLPALEVLGRVLSVGQSSRMHRNLVKGKRLAVFAGGDADAREDPGLFLVYAGFLPDQKPEAVRGALLAEVERVASGGIDARELTKAKNQLAAEHVFGLDTAEGKADELGEAELLLGGYERFLDGPKRYDAVTAAAVRDAARRYLRRENLTLVTLLPE